MYIKLSEYTKKYKDIFDYIYDNEEVFKYGKLNEHIAILTLNQQKNDVAAILNDESLVSKKLLYRANTGSFYKETRDIELPKKFDVYVTKNALKTKVISDRQYKDNEEKGLSSGIVSCGRNFKSHCGSRLKVTKSNIVGLKNIVIDIDCHDDLSPEELSNIKNKFMNLTNDSENPLFDGILPEPTLIMWSGRGFHIWYSLKEAFCLSQKWLYELVTDKLIGKLENWLNENNIDLYGLEIDKSASKNVAGFIRMPGTYNTKAGAVSQMIAFNQIKYTLDDLKSSLEIQTYKIKTFSESSPELKVIHPKFAAKTIHSKYKPDNTKSNKNSFISERINEVRRIALEQKSNGDCSNRHNLIHAFYNCAVQLMDRDAAKEETYKFNKEYFRSPVCKNEVGQAIKTIDALKPWGYYFYSDLTFGEKINSKRYIERAKNKKKTAKIKYRANLKYKRQSEKEDRNKCIIYKYKETGSFMEAAKAGGVCYNTARKIIADAGYNTEIGKQKKAAAARKTFNKFKKTNSITKAAKAGGVCYNTAKKIITIYQALAENICGIIKSGIVKIPQIIIDSIKQNHNKMNASEFNCIQKTISDITGLDKLDIKIAIASYLQTT